MKNLFLTLLCCYSFSSFAQDGFYLQPMAGYGYSNAKVEHPRDIDQNFPWGFTWLNPTKNIASYDFQALVGYQYHHWSLMSGLSFLKTGFVEDSAVGGGPGIIGYWFKETEYFYHIQVPLQIAYQFNLSKHFYVKPGIGVSFIYTYSAKEIINNYGQYGANLNTDHTLSNSDFNNNYNRTGFMETAVVNFGYKIGKRLDIIAGAEYQDMINSILKTNNNSQKNNALNFNVGVTWHMKSFPILNNSSPGKNDVSQ